MPLILEKEKDKFSFIIWKVNEDLSFFINKFDICEIEKKQIENYPLFRLYEWWASRYLLYLLEKKIKNRRSCVLKDENGKPFLQNCRKHISLSHSGEYVASAIAVDVVGIDIQKYSIKAQKVKNKFLTSKELEFAGGLKDLNAMWTIKEAVYKAYGKRKLNFKNNIIIQNYETENTVVHSKVLIKKNNIEYEYKVVSYNFDNMVLSLAKANYSNVVNTIK